MKRFGKKPIYFSLLLTLALLSHFSKFKIGAVRSFNWDIALMLTPYGILKNKVLSDTYLTPYYSLAQQSQPIDDLTLLYFAMIANTVVGLTALYFFIRSER